MACAVYLQHFGLREAPFSLTPDTDFFFADSGHREALNVLLVALRGGEGFVRITGEVGTGKTLLCRLLLRALDGEFVTCYLPNPFLTPSALRMAFAEELGIEFRRNLGQHGLLKLIHKRLIGLAAAGRRVVLCLDEAQSLPDESLESLRLLTNLETEKSKLLQVVLFGQPELERRLARHGLRQLRQRITFAYRLHPLGRRAAAAYLRHRLAVAGRTDGGPLTPRALRALTRAGGGIPRRLNILAHKALLAAYGGGAARVGARHVRRAVRDGRERLSVRGWPARQLGQAVPVAAAALALGLGFAVALWTGLVR